WWSKGWASSRTAWARAPSSHRCRNRSSPPSSTSTSSPSARTAPSSGWSSATRRAEQAVPRLMSLQDDEREQLRRKFDEYHRTGDAGLREELVTAHLRLAEYLARRFANRGQPLDDLLQVASVGLLKAVDRFDPERGLEFSTYATPTIVGELKRHFRDKGWAVRVPRRVQELHLRLGKVVSNL